MIGEVPQIRAARDLLKWTQAMLAHRAAISTVTLNMIENETVRPRETTLVAIRRALEAGGVRFIDEDGLGVGVRFASTGRPGGGLDVACKASQDVQEH